MLSLFSTTGEIRNQRLNFFLHDEIQLLSEKIDGCLKSATASKLQLLSIRHPGDMTRITIHLEPAFCSSIAHLSENDQILKIADELEVLAKNPPPFGPSLMPEISNRAGVSIYHHPDFPSGDYFAVAEKLFRLIAGQIPMPAYLFSEGPPTLRSYQFHSSSQGHVHEIELKFASKKLLADWHLYALALVDLSRFQWKKIDRCKWGVKYEHHAIELGGVLYIQNSVDSDLCLTTFEEFLDAGLVNDVQTLPYSRTAKQLFEGMRTALDEKMPYRLFDHSCETFCKEAFRPANYQTQIEKLKKRPVHYAVAWLADKILRLF